MKKTLLFLLVLLLISSCNIPGCNNNVSNRGTQNLIVDVTQNDYYSLDNNKLLPDTNLTTGDPVPANYWVFSKNNLGAGPATKPESFTQTDTLTFSVILDQSLQGNIRKYESSESIINKVLSNLNSGYAVKFNIGNLINLEKVDTRGLLNQNNIFNELDSIFELKQIETLKYNLVLFKNSEFFNTANAVCLNRNESRYIFGDGNILHSPMLFIHELGHALGLTHFNEKPIEDCDMYNIMHESNIGCALHLSQRQVMMMKADQYIPKIQIENDLDSCLCNFGNINSVVEEYLNSIDRNIDDTPIIENYTSLFTKMYKEELINGYPSPSITNTLKSNYANEWKTLIDDSSIVDSLNYINNRIEVNNKLRANNLSRWFQEINRITNPNYDESESYFSRDSTFYSNKIDTFNQLQCISITNELLSYYNEMVKYRDILSEDSEVDNCYNSYYKSLFRTNQDGFQRPPNERERNDLEIFLSSFSNRQ